MLGTEKFNVVCQDCGQVFQPAEGTPLWFRAQKKAAKGYLDALEVTGLSHGCVEPTLHPEAPYRVFGYNLMCEDFDVPFFTFVSAVKFYRSRSKVASVFISGVSPAVDQRLRF